MRALVTGAGGFVGSYLVRLLVADGVEVFAGSLDGTPPSGDPAGARWLGLDVTSAASVAAAVEEARPEAVFHLAGQASVAGSFADPVGTWDANATGTLRLVEALAAGTRMVLAGSAEVYGPVPEAEQPIREERPLRPANPYAASKAAAEMACVGVAAARGVEAVVARSFNHTGPGQDARFALPSWARQIAAIRAGSAEPVLRVGNLEARRDLLDVRDVVRAYRRLAEAGVPGTAYNVCSGAASSMREVLDALVAASGADVRVEVDPERVRPVDVPLLLGDGSRLRALGWAPEIPLRRTLADLLAAEERGTAR
ncbi:MAG TPA: GDP-mannose 4,6-dehydratase [Longimicrobium sp.]|nr:GDP-mannose 4,6-dehydratase [Longimicrobium sp.]